MLELHLQHPLIIKKLIDHSKLMLPRQKCTGFPVQCCLESLGWHCGRFLPVQYCPKSITTTLSRIFSCATLFGAFLTTIYEVFTCAQKYSLGNIEQDIFLVQCCQQPFGQHYTSFLPAPCYLKSVKTTLNKIFFLCSVVWSLFDNIAQGFYLYHVVSKVLRQHWTRFFPVQCCLEPLGQHCTKLLPVQCWPIANR